MASICSKIKLTKESTKTQKVPNGPNLVTKSESLAPEVIVTDKLRTDISVDSGLTGETRAGVTPEKCSPGKKGNIKSLSTSPTRKDPIVN